jgi:exopolyphosphatase / guanosine-5'-triphosphate,3'-diphosphate pyrophosphatase
MSEVRAAVDVGSNSVRLLVVDADGRELDRRVAITRLAAGVDATGRLADEAVERTLAVLDDYRDTWRAHGAGRVRIAATSAVRDAIDRDRFVAAVRARTGVELEVLSGAEEAALALAGATAAIEAPAPVAVVDVGGGSTEIVVETSGGPQSVSMQLGAVRLIERYLADDPPTATQVEAARAEIDARLNEGLADLAARPAPLGQAASLVAVAATATTLAALALGLEVYDRDRIHGARLDRDTLAALTDKLLATDAAGRLRFGPIQPGREGVLHAGAMILHAIGVRAPVDAMIVSESDGLDGLVAS